MAKLSLLEPISGGLLLSYKCNNECKHCMYACSPKAKADWISHEDAEKIMIQLSGILKKHHPFRLNRVSVNTGLHFTGGEPFLNFGLLLDLVKIADRLEIPSTFVETNCFWAINDKTTKDNLIQLKDAMLDGILISVNPFILEYVPFERTQRAIQISEEVFGENVIVYQEFFRQQFAKLKIKETLTFEEYLKQAGVQSLSYVELIPMGRACYRLGHLFRKFPASQFFNNSCLEELTRPWHIHIDNYGNYMTGYCGGISLGDARNLVSILEEVDLNDHPIIAKIVSPNGIEKLYELATEEFGYKELKEGYVSKCHLCIDIRKHISEQTDVFKELRPRELYACL